jgi:AraC-like DNA-binding protein
MHKHPCYEIVYYIEGDGSTTINNVAYHFHGGTFSLMAPNTEHSEEGYGPVKLVYIGFEILNKYVHLPSGLYEGQGYGIFPLMQEIDEEMEGQKEYFARYINMLTEEIVIRIMRYQDKSAKNEDDKLQYIQNYIKLNCMKNIKVKALASTFGYNYDYFRRIFKEKFGVSAKDYLMSEKIDYSLDLIKNTKYSIKEISDMTGFASPSHFVFAFKQAEHTTPKKYMEKYRISNNYDEHSFYRESQASVREPIISPDK